MKEENEIFGINIGALKTVFSKCFKLNNKFHTQVLLADDSSRVFPSVICYSKEYRLIGETAKSLYKKYLETSYVELSRFIDIIDPKSFFSEELKNMVFGSYNNNNNKKLKQYEYKEKDDGIVPSEIVADYLSMIISFYMKQGVKIEKCVLSIPDYFLDYQRKLLKTIFESIGINYFKIINESTAITMYYGYTKYKDMFVTEKINVNSGIKKEIIFIDIGHSKTSFIYSTFTYAQFKVMKVKCIPFLGGRNFNRKIKDECLKNFCDKNNYTIKDINKKSIARLLEIIEKERIKLSINKEIMITVESFMGDEDLEYHLTKENFEKLIKEEIELFINQFKEFKNEISELNKGIIPENIIIEMAGDLFRTPILQEEIIKCFDNKISISKTIIVDECTSIGSSLMGYYIFDRQDFPIPTFKNIEGYNYYQRKGYNVDAGNLDSEIKDNIQFFKIPKSILSGKKNQVIVFPCVENKDLGKYFLNITNYSLEIKVKEIDKEYKKQDFYIGIPFNENWDSKFFFATKKQGNYEIKDIPNNWITEYKTKEENKQHMSFTTQRIKENSQNKKDFDENYHKFSIKRNNLTKKFYEYKNAIKILNNNELNSKIDSLEKELKQIENKKNLKEKEKALEEFESKLSFPELDN